MNKTEFLEQLERLLWDISCQEREEALDFYRSYFEDAGEENEAQVIQELGSPGKVAAIIKADLEDGSQEREEALDFYRSYFEDAGEENEAQVIQELGSPGKVAAIIKADLEDGREGTGEEHGEYTESGYQDERFREDHVPEKAQERTGNSENTEDSRRSQQQNPAIRMNVSGKIMCRKKHRREQEIQKIQRIPEEASRVPIPITAIQERNTDTRKAEYPGRLSL